MVWLMDSRFRGNDTTAIKDSSGSLNLLFFFVIVGLDPTIQIRIVLEMTL
jgi:hypothetical protein